MSYSVEQSSYCDLLKLSLFDSKICSLQTNTSSYGLDSIPRGRESGSVVGPPSLPLFSFELVFCSTKSCVTEKGAFAGYMMAARSRQRTSPILLRGERELDLCYNVTEIWLSLPFFFWLSELMHALTQTSKFDIFVAQID